METRTQYRFQFKIDYLERILNDQINDLNEIAQHVNCYEEKLQSQICQYDNLTFQLRRLHKTVEVKGSRFEVEHLNLISNQKYALRTTIQSTLNRIEFYRQKKLNLLKTLNRQREKVLLIFKTIKKFESHKDSLSTKIQNEFLRTEQIIDAESQLLCQFKDSYL